MALSSMMFDSRFNGIIGCPFFYADYEVGIGWESKIEEINRMWEFDGYMLYLSCGTTVKISSLDLMKNGYSALRTNLKEENEQESKSTDTRRF